jgi:ligand-binding SRPBCC domain-containing protein
LQLGGDEVTWRARHFGVWQELTSDITAFELPVHFRDSMVRGAFARFDHDHFFVSADGGTALRDVFDYEAPLGLLGWLAERLFLSWYMRRGLLARMHEL